MEGGERLTEEPDWRSTVIVRPDLTLAAELGGRWESARGDRVVGVTDLLAPRPAYWKWVAGPAVPTPERRARLESGRRLHLSLDRLLDRGAKLEVRVRRDGIAARIDALTDRPVEFKTTGRAPEPEELLRERPEYAEQLGMYCALAESAAGRLIMLASGGDPEDLIRTVDISFRDPSRIHGAMRRGAEALRSAVASGSAAALPRCRWFDRGCEFRAGAICDCTGDEPEPEDWLRTEVAELRPRPEEDGRLAGRLPSANAEASPLRRFRDLLYPRRSFFERRRPLTETAGQAAGGTLPSPPSEVYLRLLEAIEGGPVGDVARLPGRATEPAEEVPAFRGLPYLARTSRAPTVPQPGALLANHPQYALELGFRCAATGTTGARVILAYERASDPAARLQVFEFEFGSTTVFSRLWRSRERQLESALASGAPLGLPACPAWMYSACPYRDECGCGAAPGRSQR
jgi:hypothetical protein